MAFLADTLGGDDSESTMLAGASGLEAACGGG
jgi:hypothetical protein